MKYAVAMILCFTVIVACAESRAEPQKYATLENLATDKVKLEIKDTRWTPLVGPSGFGGNKESLYFWATLEGAGPVYQNPELHENGPNFYQSLGTITVDRKKGTVTIELNRVLSKAGEPQRTEPSPANGTYAIK